jgi:hypothetical protein
MLIKSLTNFTFAVSGMDTAVYFCAGPAFEKAVYKEECHHEPLDLARNAAGKSEALQRL